MEAHGSPATTFIQKAAGLLPRAIAAPIMETAGVDRLNALYSAIDIVRRGGTISLSGVYGGMADPIPMLTLFDKQIQLRMGQCNIKRWIPEIMPLLTDGDPLGCDTFATHRVPLSEAPEMYRKFQEKADGVVKVTATHGLLDTPSRGGVIRRRRLGLPVQGGPRRAFMAAGECRAGPSVSARALGDACAARRLGDRHRLISRRFPE
jgi:hypothetical protein